MSNEKFTRGVWFVECGNEVNTEQKNICRCIRLAMEPEEARANAALIAAAPDMYRVLSGICLEKSAQICKFAPESCEVCQIRKALKKARWEE